MAKKVTEKPNEEQPTTFTKAQLIKAKAFIGQADVLAVVLEENKMYTIEQALQLANEFLKRRIN